MLTQPLVFIGEVVAIRGNGGQSPKAVFKVERPIVGDPGPVFETLQGNGGDCGMTFKVGSTVLFAGDGEWSPTVIFANPPTRQQRLQLGFVKRVMMKGRGWPAPPR